MKQINIFFLIFILLISNTSAANNTEFENWKKKFKAIALKNKISEKTFDLTMSNVRFLPKVIEYDRYQPEFYEDTKTYISKRSSNKKVEKGLNFYNQDSSAWSWEIELRTSVEKF